MSQDRQRGVVKWFNEAKGYGFIVGNENGSDIFVHFRNILGEGHKTLRDGQPVEFRVVEGPKGLQAEEVEVVEE